jgi:hypothetical protein
MSVWANIAGTWRKSTLWGNVGGTWHKLTPWVNVGGTWKKDPAPSTAAMTVSANPASVNGAISRPAGGGAQTNETTITVTGGTAPFTYAWSSSDGVLTATSPSSSATRFSAFVEAGDTLADTFACVVTDANAQTAATTVSASVSNYGKQLNAAV